jgi:hypothetical protein
MAGTSYLVDIELAVSGNPGAAIGGAKSDMASLSDLAKGTRKELSQLGASLASGFTGVVEGVVGKLATLGQVGAAGALAAVAYGVTGLNNDLETTRVSLGAVLNANGVTNGIEQGMERASGWIVQMKKDAKDLPGEFKDLLAFVQNAAAPALGAGLSVSKFEALSAQSMAASKALMVPMDQGAREYAQLLEGRAGAHNVFGTRLGIGAEGFNDKSAEDRIKILTEKLGKFQPAIEAFGHTFDAGSSALIDNAKSYLTEATMPLFERTKGVIADANAWFKDNEGTVKAWTADVGDFLVDAFDRGKAIIFEYGPPLLRFVRTAKDEFLSIWKEAGPLVAGIGESVKGFLNDPGAMNKLETFAKLYLAVKAGSAIGGGSGVGGVAGGALQFGAAGYAAGAATGVDGMGAVGAGAASGASIGGSLGGATGAAFGAATGAAAGSMLSLGEAITGLVQADREYNQTLLEHNRQAQDAYGRIDTNSKGFADAVAEASKNVNWLSSMFESAADSMQVAAAKLNAKLDQAILDDTRRKGFGKIDATLAEAERVNQAKKAEFAAAADAAAAKKKKTVEGKGGMTINKVEITVSSNQSPEQVARMTFAELSHLRRFRTSSPRTLNFSAGR